MDEVATLCSHLHSLSPRKRLRAVRALRAYRDPRVTPALCSLLLDDDWCVRINAALALGACGDRTAVPALTRVLRRYGASDASLIPPAREFRARVAAALGEIAQRDPAPELRLAIPLLGGDLPRWLVRDEFRRPLEQIDAATRGWRALPLPLEHAALPALDCPIPVAPPHEPGTGAECF